MMAGQWFDVLPMTQVAHRLYVGGYAAAQALADYNPANITAVLNVHHAPDAKRSPNIIYMHVPFADGEAIPKRQFVECLGWLKFMYETGHTILVHCAAGISRSVTIVTSAMHYLGLLDFNSALDRIRMSRPVANPAPVTLNSAKKFLGVWPEDGSLASTPEHEKTIHEIIEQVQSQRSARLHPNPHCPARMLLESPEGSNVPRHEVPCTCEKLLTPMEIAREKMLIESASACILCGGSFTECACDGSLM
jgi:hypothetical protein